MWKIPLFDLNYDSREEEAVLAVLRSRWLTMGPRTHEFEERFGAYLGEGSRCLALSSCTAALHLSLLASGIGQGDEVIVSSLSFVACLNVVTLVGATPVLADCKSLTDWNADPEDIQAKITDRTKAIMVVHFAGYPCDMGAICNIARENDLLLIEDVAHAVGATLHGQQCGTFSDIACFSFFSNKNLSVGEGGMVVTRRPELYEKLKLLRSHGMTSLTVDRHNQKSISYDVVTPGFNYRMDEIRASLGIVQLGKLDSANMRRRELTEVYRRYLAELGGVVAPWDNLNSAIVPSCHIMPVLLPVGADRLTVMEKMRAEGIQTSLHYPAYADFKAYGDFFRNRPLIADEISRRVLTLPLYPDMSESMVGEICEQIHRAIG